MDLDHWKEYTNRNILTKREAMKITGQSLKAFDQSVATGRIKPVFERGEGTGKVRLYLRSEIVEYAKRVQGKKIKK